MTPIYRERKKQEVTPLLPRGASITIEWCTFNLAPLSSLRGFSTSLSFLPFRISPPNLITINICNSPLQPGAVFLLGGLMGARKSLISLFAGILWGGCFFISSHLLSIKDEKSAFILGTGVSAVAGLAMGVRFIKTLKVRHVAFR